MSARPTAEEFRQHLGTKFGVRVQTPRPIELELAEVKDYTPQDNEPTGMERFSLFFYGPGDIMLKQGTSRWSTPRWARSRSSWSPTPANREASATRSSSTTSKTVNREP